LISVLVVEANQVLRLGIRSVLEMRNRFFIAAEIHSKEQLLSSFLRIEFDVVLVELNIFQSIDPAIFSRFRKCKPNVNFLVHSHTNDINPGVEAIKSGALGYLTRHCSPADLGYAISTVCKGRPFITELIGEALAESLFRPSNIAHTSLSEREFQVFRMLAIGINITGIAAQLELSIKTVSTYKARILNKMNLPGISELVRYAICHSLLLGCSDENEDGNPSGRE
jgi:DNA-binding NarL/FixJ family response regulator